MITVDNVAYDVLITSNIERAFSLKQGGQGGTAQTGREIPDIIGTDYVYTITVEPNKSNFTAYDSFYEAISSPVDYHSVTLPYGQTTITFDAMILSGQDTLKRKAGTSNRWGALSLQFVPITPQRTTTASTVTQETASSTTETTSSSP